MKHVLIATCLAAWTLLCACAEDAKSSGQRQSTALKATTPSGATSDRNGSQSDAIAVITGKDAGPCTEADAGKLVYMLETKTLLVCNGSAWGEALSGAKGDKGDDGDKGDKGDGIAEQVEKWRAVFKDSVQRTAYIRATYFKTHNSPAHGADYCKASGSGTGFIVGKDLVATNGHVVEAQLALEPVDPVCGSAMPLSKVEVWFPDATGDTRHHARSPDATATRVDRSIAQSDDLALLEVATGSRAPLTLSKRDESADHISGDGVRLGEEVLLLGFSLGTTFVHFATGKVTGIQPVNAELLPGFIDEGKLVYQYDLVSASGASGGAVFDAAGEVVGINFAGYTPSANFDMGYALQAKHLRKLLGQARVWTSVP